MRMCEVRHVLSHGFPKDSKQTKNNKSIWDFFKRKKSLDLIEWLCMGMCEVHHVLSHGFPEEFQTKNNKGCL